MGRGREQHDQTDGEHRGRTGPRQSQRGRGQPGAAHRFDHHPHDRRDHRRADRPHPHHEIPVQVAVDLRQGHHREHQRNHDHDVRKHQRAHPEAPGEHGRHDPHGQEDRARPVRVDHDELDVVTGDELPRIQVREHQVDPLDEPTGGLGRIGEVLPDEREVALVGMELVEDRRCPQHQPGHERAGDPGPHPPDRRPAGTITHQPGEAVFGRRLRALVGSAPVVAPDHGGDDRHRDHAATHAQVRDVGLHAVARGQHQHRQHLQVVTQHRPRGEQHHRPGHQRQVRIPGLFHHHDPEGVHQQHHQGTDPDEHRQATAAPPQPQRHTDPGEVQHERGGEQRPRGRPEDLVERGEQPEAQWTRVAPGVHPEVAEASRQADQGRVQAEHGAHAHLGLGEVEHHVGLGASQLQRGDDERDDERGDERPRHHAGTPPPRGGRRIGARRRVGGGRLVGHGHRRCRVTACRLTADTRAPSRPPTSPVTGAPNRWR